MNILIAGATGFVGRKLVAALLHQHQYTITVLGRNAKKLKRYFKAPINIITWDQLTQLTQSDASTCDVIINLSGYNIAASRWSPKVKKELIDSRVNTTKSLIDWAIQNKAKPHFICANAVGIYGTQEPQDNQALDESSPIDFDHPRDFLSEIGVRWQQATLTAVESGMPVTILRFGVVLGKEEGMLKKLGLSFNLGLGAVVGDGEQIISWVHIDDLVSAILFLINKLELPGVYNIYNLTSPNPVSQSEFARTLASSMHRPMFLKIPAFLIRTLFGEMGNYLLLQGQRVVPTRLLEAGFKFQYPELRNALSQEFSR